jgi:hypothetical protein
VSWLKNYKHYAACVVRAKWEQCTRVMAFSLKVSWAAGPVGSSQEQSQHKGEANTKDLFDTVLNSLKS